MVRCGFKNGHKIDMHLKEIGLHVQSLLSVLESIMNKIKKVYMVSQ